MRHTIPLVLLLGLLGAGAAPFTVSAAHAADPHAGHEEGGRKILYYRNPMGLADTSPVPKKDSMGMDYIPVYADEMQEAPGTVVLGPQTVQKLGVRTAAVQRAALARTLRASARIEIDEARRHAIAPKFEGWVERLHANRTGIAVRRGEPLAEVYSPALVSAQEEYLIARRALGDIADPEARAAMERLAQAALERLRNWDITAAALGALHAGRVARTLALHAPRDGIVIEKPALEGMRFMAGDTLLVLADLSSVWVVAELGAGEMALAVTGQELVFTTPALPGERFAGRIDFIYPTLSAETRTLKLRASVPNRDGMLRPALLGEALIATGDARERLLIPRSALIDSGRRRIVLVAHEGGRFEPRPVTTGLEGEESIEVLEGLAAGEEVVVAANFLIDAESNLRAALQKLAPHEGH